MQAARRQPENWELWRLWFETNAGVMATLERRLADADGLSLRRLDVLLQLAHADAGRLTMGELADRVVISRSGLTGLVDRMERRGLVERSTVEGNRRATAVRLTPEGRRAFERAWRSHEQHVDEAFLSKLGRSEREALAGVLDRLRG